MRAGVTVASPRTEIHQADLETVIPAAGAQVRVVGPSQSSRKGTHAQLLQREIQGRKNHALVKFEDDSQIMEWAYDDICALG